MYIHDTPADQALRGGVFLFFFLKALPGPLASESERARRFPISTVLEPKDESLMARCTFNKECHFNTPRLERRGATMRRPYLHASLQAHLASKGVLRDIFFVTMMMDEKAKIPHSTGKTLRRTKRSLNSFCICISWRRRRRRRRVCRWIMHSSFFLAILVSRVWCVGLCVCVLHVACSSA
jgi:hypothetical protein